MANNKKAHNKKTRKKSHRAPVQATALTPDKKERKKIAPAKLFGIIGGVVGAVAIAVLIFLLVRGVSKDIKNAVSEQVMNSFAYEAESIIKEKKYKPENSEFDKEVYYLVSGNLKTTGEGKWLDDGKFISIVRVTTLNGEENIEVKIVNVFKKNDKTSFNQTLTELKDYPIRWQERFE